MRRRIVAANWKMNGSLDLVNTLVGSMPNELAALDKDVEVVIIPPALYVAHVAATLSNSSAGLGVQNIAQWQSGAYTGELSAAMARDVGCGYALAGHSERRSIFGETDADVAQKVEQALHAGLSVIVCVGETLAQREAGLASDVVGAQIKEALKEVSGASWQQVVLAYEPIWAIGTGETATADDAQAVHASMRRVLEGMGAPASRISLLYGGSVKPDNARELFSQPDIDGGLIGGASLKKVDFLAICRAV
jgi:triosephosphate isomerase